MSFWKSLGGAVADFGKTAMDSMQKQAELYQKYQSESDEFLVKKMTDTGLFGSSPAEVMAAKGAFAKRYTDPQERQRILNKYK